MLSSPMRSHTALLVFDKGEKSRILILISNKTDASVAHHCGNRIQGTVSCVIFIIELKPRTAMQLFQAFLA